MLYFYAYAYAYGVDLLELMGAELSVLANVFIFDILSLSCVIVDFIFCKKFENEVLNIIITILIIMIMIESIHILPIIVSSVYFF